MAGSVFHQEMMLGGRRSRLYVVRWVYVSWLVLQIFLLWVGYMILESEHRNAILNSSASAANNPASAAGVVGSWFIQGVDGPWYFRMFFPGFVSHQMVLLLLATPAFVAGAITEEKRRGTLQYLLTAGLDTRHIVLSKMFARVSQVALLTLAGLPVYALLAGFAGVEPVTLLLTVVALLAPMFALSAATMLASVLCRQTWEAVLLMYFFALVGWPFVVLVGGPLQAIDPTYALDPVWAPWNNIDWSELWLRLGVEVAAWGTLGCACLGVAVWQLRRVYIRELESPPQNPAWGGQVRPAVGDDPVRWHELYFDNPISTLLKIVSILLAAVGVVYALYFAVLWLLSGAASASAGPAFSILIYVGVVCGVLFGGYYAARRATRGSARLAQWLGVGLAAAVSTVSSLTILWYCLPPAATLPALTDALLHLDVGRLRSMMPVGAEILFLCQGLAVMLLGSFIVAVRCSGAISGERERQTWEAVLLTPLSAKQLVHGKLWGVMAACYWYLLAYAVPAVLLSAVGGLDALFRTSILLAVALLAMYYMGAIGLWFSARSKTSWHSLLATMLVGYLVWFFLLLVCLIPATILTFIVMGLLWAIDQSCGTQLFNPANKAGVMAFLTSPPCVALMCIAMAGAFVLVSQMLLGWAQRWIADRERTRHWHEEPVYRRARRAPVYQPRYNP